MRGILWKMDGRLYTGVAWNEVAAMLLPIPIMTADFCYDWGKFRYRKAENFQTKPSIKPC